jgi:malonyl CoA-acyl carrier protein transacylase
MLTFFQVKDRSFRAWEKTSTASVFLPKKLFEQANEILGFRISDIMFEGTEEQLKQTRVTQPAVFLHSVVAFKGIDVNRADMVAGHSLGEFSALVANGVLSFEDGLKLVSVRAQAMQKACEINPFYHGGRAGPGRRKSGRSMCCCTN